MFEVPKFSGAARRWVEFHWGNDTTAIWSWGCRHSADQFAKATCKWLMQHTNQEFSMMLPQRIMACHGYTFPKMAYYDWDDMVGTIRLRGNGDRRVLLDLNYGKLPNGEQAMRLSVEDELQNYEPDKLPPIEPLPSSDADRESR